jgi:type I restriction enzyme S subunit
VADANPSNIDKKSKDNENTVLLCNYVDVYKNEFISSELNFMKATASNDQITKFILEKGDVIITKDSETPDDIAAPALVAENFDNVVCGYHLTHIKPKKTNGNYLFRYFQSKYLNSYFEVSANGVTRYGLSVDKINSALILNPPRPEQIAIANYLDRKTAGIDELIAQKERLLELYEEEKTAIINQAVTKGIDPDVKLKDSGIDWLGEIPEGWEVKKLKYILNDKLKYGANESAIDENPEEPRYIRITDFGNDGKLKSDTFKSLSFAAAKEYFLSNGDVLFARSGATVGKTFQFKNYNEIACFAGYLIKASPNEDIILSDFLYFYTKSSFYERWKSSIFNQATIQNIGADKYAFLDVPIPKIGDQLAIVHHIEIETARINAKITKTKKIIELQREYRTALISEVVTGKIKVTQEAAS